MRSLRYLIATSIYPLAAFAVSLILTRICIAVLPRLGYMDIPKGRHIHKVPVPRAGGIGFILAFWITIFLYLAKYYHLSELVQAEIGQFLIPLAGGSVILFFTGLYDDRYDMPSVIKLAFQIDIAFHRAFQIVDALFHAVKLLCLFRQGRFHCGQLL